MNDLQVQAPIHLFSMVTKCQIANIITIFMSHFLMAVTGSVTSMNFSMARHCEQYTRPEIWYVMESPQYTHDCALYNIRYTNTANH